MDTESGDAVPEPAAGDTPGRRFRESDGAWARLDEFAEQQGSPPEWEGLDKVARAQGRSRTAVLRDAVASYIAAWEQERRGRGARGFRESDGAWARLDEIAQQQGFPPEKGRAHVIREAIRWYFAVWEGLDKVAGAQGRSRTAVLRDAVASYIAAWELERRGR